MAQVSFQLNGRGQSATVEEGTSLLLLLREQLGLTGTKYGCGESQCGACTVHLDGKAIRSCVTPAETVSGKSVTTIEGLAQNGRLHPVQQAFLDADAYQCGYCTPGMIMAAASFLKDHPRANETEIKTGLNGNVCRCGTYPKIVQAVQLAQASISGAGSQRRSR